MATSAIYNTDYIESLKTQLGNSMEGIEEHLSKLETTFAGHTGLWEDEGSSGPVHTFEALLGEMRTTIDTFNGNLSTTIENVSSYQGSVAEVNTTYNFAAKV